MEAGNNPFPRFIEIEAPEFRYVSKSTIHLPIPDLVPTIPFFSVLATRRSNRNFQALSTKSLSDLLWFTNEIIATSQAPNGNIYTLRPVPSAGAVHPIYILVIQPSKTPLELFVYSAEQHLLNLVDTDNFVLANFIQHVNESLAIQEGTLLWFIGHLEKTRAKYFNCESLVWRDAGCLLFAIQIAATALGLNSCPLGTLGRPYLDSLFEGEIISGGGVLIGSTG